MTALLLAATSLPHLMPDGWGAVKIGMTQAQVGKALGAKLEGEPIEEGEVCVEMSSAAVSDMWFMFEEGKLTRISIGLSSKITTPRGIGLRTSVVQVRKAYGRRLEEKPHYYVGLPAQYLTYWTVPGERGVRFETSTARRVETIHAGLGSIQYIEGCA